MWAYERPGGGRGVGFTGLHFHRNFQNDQLRKLMLNAILWSAGREVPARGVASHRPTEEEIEANQDYPKPLRKKRQPRAPQPAGNEKKTEAESKPLARSPIITARTKGRRATLEADLGAEPTKSRTLYLVVDDAGNGYSCDWADWIDPRLSGPAGSLSLTELPLRSATSDWGQSRVNANAGGAPMRVAGKPIERGIGTHANSILTFELPPGYDTFQCEVALDDGGTDQGCGAQASVRFSVWTSAPPETFFATRPAQGGPLTAGAALEDLEVSNGLEATLFAAEPMLTSPTNIDIDERGRVFVCDVVNYRRNNGKRPEGDRILILSDEDGDGRADAQKVYYQGRDIDSALGICVLGNKVIVSCSPNILVFTDEDGDDVPDRKETLFTKVGKAQHDHSAHAFVAGPDGRLYWNFGKHRRCRTRCLRQHRTRPGSGARSGMHAPTWAA